MIITTDRRVSSIHRPSQMSYRFSIYEKWPQLVQNVPKPGDRANNELDSHADTSAVGRNFVPINHNGTTCTVSPFLDTHYEPVSEIPIVTAATAWTNPATAITYILIYLEVLWFGTVLLTTLIHPNQLRKSGISVLDNPFTRMSLSITIHQHDLIRGQVNRFHKIFTKIDRFLCITLIANGCIA
jgi:hypothetical protein